MRELLDNPWLGEPLRPRKGVTGPLGEAGARKVRLHDRRGRATHRLVYLLVGEPGAPSGIRVLAIGPRFPDLRVYRIARSRLS